MVFSMDCMTKFRALVWGLAASAAATLAFGQAGAGVEEVIIPPMLHRRRLAA
jgi:hypothetical protein